MKRNMGLIQQILLQFDVADKSEEVEGGLLERA